MTFQGRIAPEWMRWWGEHATTSPLYLRLVEVVAESDDLLRVINRIENPHKPTCSIARCSTC